MVVVVVGGGVLRGWGGRGVSGGGSVLEERAGYGKGCLKDGRGLEGKESVGREGVGWKGRSGLEGRGREMLEER